MTKRKPSWLKVPPPWGDNYSAVRKQLRKTKLHTVCEAAKCPNIGECFNLGTATFLLMGEVCTRHCRFCNIGSGKVLPLNKEEPGNIAAAVASLRLKFAVITSVTRDDLPDGGADHFAQTIRAIRKLSPDTGIEVLIPDLQGNRTALDKIIDAGPDVINHNIETIERLYPQVRPEADYNRSLDLLSYVASNSKTISKSGFMLGLGETEDEVVTLLRDLRSAGCLSVTIGQYLAPSDKHFPVYEYVTPGFFDKAGSIAREMGFEHVMSAPLVRSSYHAGDSDLNLHGR
jgi:lipoic acid synthetase